MNPRLTFPFLTGTLLAVAATGLVFTTDLAMAQQAADEMEEVAVEESGIVTTRAVRQGLVRNEAWELKRSINYADLDLRLHKDVTVLEMRIESAAKEVCEQLADFRPRLTEPDPSCVMNAVASAREELQAAIAATGQLQAKRR